MCQIIDITNGCDGKKKIKRMLPVLGSMSNDRKEKPYSRILPWQLVSQYDDES